MKKQHIITLVIAVVTAVAGFFGGIKYQQTKIPAVAGRGAGQFAGGAGAQNRGGNRGGAGFVGGSILSKDQNSITVKDQTGGSKIILLSNKTSVGKTTTTTPDDLLIGENVIVNGSPNTDGSITATNIQIRPTMPSQPGAGK